jgi:hypothetical protein
MPEYQAVLTVFVNADDQDAAANMIDARMPLAYRLERIQVAYAVTGPGPADGSIRQLACAHKALLAAGGRRWRGLPRLEADLVAGRLVADFIVATGSCPVQAEVMIEYTRDWIRRHDR